MGAQPRSQHFFVGSKHLIHISFLWLYLVENCVVLVDLVIAAFAELLLQILKHGLLPLLLFLLNILSQFFLVVAFEQLISLMLVQYILESNKIKRMQSIYFLSYQFVFCVEIRDGKIDRLHKDAIFYQLRLYLLNFIDEFDHGQFLFSVELKFYKCDPKK